MQEFDLVKRGYDPEEVDKYIRQLERTVQEYKDKDAAISNAILNAQVAADNIVRNANIRAEDILKVALEKLESVHRSVEKQKQVVKNFQEDYTDMVNRYLKNIQTKDFLEIFQTITELENYLVSFTEYNSPQKSEPEQMTKPMPKLHKHIAEEARLESEANSVESRTVHRQQQQQQPLDNMGISPDELSGLMGNVSLGNE